MTKEFIISEKSSIETRQIEDTKMRPNRIRDKNIATEVLNCSNVRSVAEKYSLSTTRVHQITHIYCWTNYRALYIKGEGKRDVLERRINRATDKLEDVIITKKTRPTINYLSENKDMFEGDGRL